MLRNDVLGYKISKTTTRPSSFEFKREKGHEKTFRFDYIKKKDALSAS